MYNVCASICCMGDVWVSRVMYGPVGNVWVIYGLVGQCMGQLGGVWASWVMYGPVG